MMNDYSYGEVLSDLQGLLNRWNHDEIRFAEPRRSIDIDVRGYLDMLLKSCARGRSNKISTRIVSNMREDGFAQKLVILAAIRHCVRILESWSPPMATRAKYVFNMSKANRCVEPFARMCRYEIVCGKCNNKNCPFSHDSAKVANYTEDESWIDNLPSQEEFSIALTG
jgi:hypothetical protein